MKTNSTSYLLIIGLILTFLSCKTSKLKNDNDEKPPNFIVILTDDQGWNGTSVQMMDDEVQSKSDYHQTPNLEKLANRGMRFSSAYASAPVCSPSRYSIQFGQTPARLKMIRVGMNTKHINHQTSYTIPKLLKKVNPDYKAAHFGKWGIGVHPSELGYDESDGITGKLISAIWDPWQDFKLYKEDLMKSDIYTLKRIIPEDRGMNWPLK